MTAPGPPIGILAELTHRCPLQCPYCSNPLELLKASSELTTEEWCSTFEQAAEIGVLQVHLSGGEPALRSDLEQMVGVLARRGVYTNLITAGVTLTADRIRALADSGLDHVQVSFQGASTETTDRIGKMRGAHAKKLKTAELVRDAGLPLTVNAPIHRDNIHEVPDFIELALALGAERLEIANTQYYGWALLNRDRLMPDRDTAVRMADFVQQERARLVGVLPIDFVTPDYYAEFPKPCMGGWARDAFMIAPDGKVMPCHAAGTIPHLTFDNVRDVSLGRIWEDSIAFNAYRGTTWMQEPCRSCERREIDFGGCRCQALAITGEAGATDPACSRSLHNPRILAIAVSASAAGKGDYKYRRIS